MSVTLVETPGSATANSYLTKVEAQAYFDARIEVSAWEDDSDAQDRALVMATRVLDAMLSPETIFVPAADGESAYFKTRACWSGSATDAVQALCWPRAGMLSRNGFAIADTVIPQDLKNAVAELAGQLMKSDRTIDNATVIKGIKKLSAGPVSIEYNAGQIQTTKILPDMVRSLLVPSWITLEAISYPATGEFEVFGPTDLASC